MGRHGQRRRATVCVVRDPRRAAPRWQWLLPALGLALWPVAPGMALLAVVVLLVAVAVVVRHRLGGIRIAGSAVTEWRAAEAALREVRLRWPALGAMAEPADIRPTLELTAFNLARLIAARDRLQAEAGELRAARRDLRPGDLRDRLDERLEATADRQRDLEAQLTARIEALGRLAASLDAHERREEAAARVRALLATELPGIRPVADPMSEVGERTAATLEAYQELSELRP